MTKINYLFLIILFILGGCSKYTTDDDAKIIDIASKIATYEYEVGRTINFETYYSYLDSIMSDKLFYERVNQDDYYISVINHNGDEFQVTNGELYFASGEELKALNDLMDQVRVANYRDFIILRSNIKSISSQLSMKELYIKSYWRAEISYPQFTYYFNGYHFADYHLTFSKENDEWKLTEFEKTFGVLEIGELEEYLKYYQERQDAPKVEMEFK